MGRLGSKWEAPDDLNFLRSHGSYHPRNLCPSRSFQVPKLQLLRSQNRHEGYKVRRHKAKVDRAEPDDLRSDFESDQGRRDAGYPGSARDDEIAYKGTERGMSGEEMEERRDAVARFQCDEAAEMQTASWYP